MKNDTEMQIIETSKPSSQLVITVAIYLDLVKKCIQLFHPKATYEED